MFDEILKLILVGLSSGIATFYCLLKYFFSSYASEKGKNLATKQDIADITKEVEEVKHQYNLIMEEFRGRNQLRMAALDKRLEVHQKAFFYCMKINSAIQIGNEQEIANIRHNCESWWWDNSLYLEVKARDAFWKAFCLLRLNFYDLPQESQDKITKRLDEAFKAIEEGVELPQINYSDVFKKDEKKASN